MISVRKFWPVVVWALALLLNTDLLIPILVGAGLSMSVIVLTVSTVANIEITYSYWFWGWVVRETGELEKVQQVRRELRRNGVWDWLLAYCLNLYRKVINPDNRLVQKINKWGLAVIIIASLLPVSGLRTTCTVFCGIFRWKRGLIALLLFNTVHVLSMVWGWEKIISLFGH